MPQKSARYYAQLKRKLEDEYTPAFFYALRVQKKPLLDAFRSTDNLEIAILRLRAAAMNIRHEPVMKVYNRLYKRVSLNEANDLYRSMITTKRLGGLAIDWLADIVDFLDTYILDQVVRPLTERTVFRMYRTIVNGMALGQSYDQMLKALEDTELDKVRARLIARTEVNRAVNYGHELGNKDLPFSTDKVWSSARDRRTRGAEGDDKADHFHLNGMKTGPDGLFTDPRSGAKMAYPGDSQHGAGAADVCNCRCVLMYQPVRDKNGQLIMKN